MQSLTASTHRDRLGPEPATEPELEPEPEPEYVLEFDGLEEAATAAVVCKPANEPEPEPEPGLGLEEAATAAVVWAKVVVGREGVVGEGVVGSLDVEVARSVVDSGSDVGKTAAAVELAELVEAIEVVVGRPVVADDDVVGKAAAAVELTEL
eukprot:583744-Rhodomonas_salina.1